ncbi:MAG: sigma-70 family RNA polymerase sigma factor [Tepidisphaeraceae bacterium]
MDDPGVSADARATNLAPPPALSTHEADGAALARIASGDFAPFDKLVDRYKHRIFRHIRRRIADPHRAEDLTQEAFLRLFRAARAGRYTGRARVVTWLFAIAGNVVTDHLRAEGVRSSIRIVREQSEPDDPLDAAAAREGESRMRRLLLELPEAQRTVVELHVLDGLTFADVAELVGCPVPTVKSRLVYALRKLKRLMGGPQGNES